MEETLAERCCREEVGFGTFAEALGKYNLGPVRATRPAGPDARSATGAPPGVQRWKCLDFGPRHDSLTGTVFEHARYGLPKWFSFICLIRLDLPLECIAESLGVSHQTAWGRRHRVFATVNGYQDGIVPGDRVWIDEAHASDTDLAHGYGQARKRGALGAEALYRRHN